MLRRCEDSFALLFPNEKVEVSTSGPSLVLRGEVSNEVVYDKVLEMAHDLSPAQTPRGRGTEHHNQREGAGGIQNRPNITGFGIAGGGQIAFDEEPSMT